MHPNNHTINPTFSAHLRITNITYNHLNLPVSVTNHLGTHATVYAAGGSTSCTAPDCPAGSVRRI